MCQAFLADTVETGTRYRCVMEATHVLRRELRIKLEIRVSQNLAKLGGEPIKGGGGEQESNEVNQITGEGGTNIGS